MTVKSEVKAERRRILADHVRREQERTGLNAFEQWVERVGDVNPVHRRINQRAQEQFSREWHQAYWRQYYTGGSS